MVLCGWDRQPCFAAARRGGLCCFADSEIPPAGKYILRYIGGRFASRSVVRAFRVFIGDGNCTPGKRGLVPLRACTHRHAALWLATHGVGSWVSRRAAGTSGTDPIPRKAGIIKFLSFDFTFLATGLVPVGQQEHTCELPPFSANPELLHNQYSAIHTERNVI